MTYLHSVARKRNVAAFSAVAVTALALNAAAQSGGPIKLQMEPQGAKANKLGYYPVQVKLSPTKPEGVKKEPAYRATPKYAVIHVGNGPKSAFVIALDEPEKEDYKIYFDKNGNGDLTDDGQGQWDNKREGARPMYGVNSYVVRGSWGSASKETSSGDYGIAMYRFVGQDYLLMYREGTRVGTVTVDGKPHKALLAENDADGVYAKPLGDDGKPVGGGMASRPVWLAVDLNDDGKFAGDELLDARSPFKLGDKVFEAKIAMDGSTLEIAPTTRKVPEKPKVAERPPLLPNGTLAPDFKAIAYGGSDLKLSDYKGKVVILDFWATWCGPCQKSMPHIEKVYQQVKDQNVVVLGVCVWDEKDAYEKWVPANSSKYTFKFAFDPAGRGTDSIAGKLFNVSGIPTTYIIDKDGKVAASIVGYSEGDTRVEDALKKIGVTTTSQK